MNKFDFARSEVRPWNGRVKWLFPYWPLTVHPVFGVEFRWVMTLYRLLELESKSQPLKERCDNCGAMVEKCGTDSNGRKICCVHCVFHPLGCRCQYGEFGVPQEYAPYDPDDDDEFFDDDYGDWEPKGMNAYDRLWFDEVDRAAGNTP